MCIYIYVQHELCYFFFVQKSYSYEKSENCISKCNNHTHRKLRLSIRWLLFDFLGMKAAHMWGSKKNTWEMKKITFDKCKVYKVYVRGMYESLKVQLNSSQFFLLLFFGADKPEVLRERERERERKKHKPSMNVWMAALCLHNESPYIFHMYTYINFPCTYII